MDWLYRRKITLGFGFVSLALLAVAAWLTHDTWLAWYYVHGLKHSSEQDRDVWIDRVASLGPAAVPPIVALLKNDDAGTCDKAVRTLVKLCDTWGHDDERTMDLHVHVAQSFEGLSFAGQQAVLKLHAGRLHDEEHPPASYIELTVRPLQIGMQSSCKDVRGVGYELLMLLVRCDHASQHLSLYREFLRKGLKEEDARLRARAVCAAGGPDFGLLDDIVPMLHDPSAEVRRAAMLAVGPAATVIHDDELLPWLNDEDAQVCHLCEIVLEGRGIPKSSIRLARMINHPQVAVRLQAVDELLEQPDHDPTEWFRRLSHDRCPSVQVAAIRAARVGRLDLRDRLEEMVRSEPSATVRQLAAYYLAVRD